MLVVVVVVVVVVVLVVVIVIVVVAAVVKLRLRHPSLVQTSPDPFLLRWHVGVS